MAPSSSIKNVVVLGATGNIGIPIIEALLNHPNHYIVTAVTRSASKASFPSTVKVVESDLSPSSLRPIFRGQDAVICSLATGLTSHQTAIIDVAIECGVRRFLPSEFGMDSANPDGHKYLPVIAEKAKIVEYLKTKEDQISWTAVIVGAFFDWGLRLSAPITWNIPERKAPIYDGGNYEHEVTNVAQIGNAVAAMLAPEHEEETANEFVYVNSFTTTQNEILAALEKVVGEKFEVTSDTAAGLRERMLARKEKDPKDGLAGLGVILASFYGQGRINEYSKTAPSGLWNKRLGLPEESLEETVRKVVAEYK